MSQTQIACPQCRNMIPARVEQLFDVTADPGAKQRLLGGVSNYANCPMCGYHGPLATPIVYHDADKELLLTYFPPELSVPVHEQEKIIGPLLKKIMDSLALEKRKAYLLSPQSHFTYQSFVERILGADGITPEMLKAQQDRVNLIQRLLTASADDVRLEIIKQEARLVDQEFFALYSRLLQNAAASGQEQMAQLMAGLEELLLKNTEYGKKLQAQANEIEAATKSLQETGNSLTREKLLDIFIAAPNEDRLRALVNMTRQGMDYVFFQTLTERIEAANGEEKTRLETLRERLLALTNEIDQQIEAQAKQATQFLETLLTQDDITKATQANLHQFNEATIQALNTMLQNASQKKDEALLEKLKKVVQVIQEASAPPPEVMFIEELLELNEETAIEAKLNENLEQLSDEFVNTLGGLVTQMESAGESNQLSEQDKDISARLQRVYRVVLKIMMKKNLTQ